MKNLFCSEQMMHDYLITIKGTMKGTLTIPLSSYIKAT